MEYEIDWETMTHECGGMVFELETHKENERKFWCMNCDKTIIVEEDDEQQNW